MHHCHLEDVGKGKRHGVVRDSVYLGIIGIEQRDDLVTGKKDSCPVVRGVELGDCVPPGAGVSEIPSLGTSEQVLRELGCIYIGGDDHSGHAVEGRPESIAVGFHLLLGHLIRVCIDVQVIGCTCRCKEGGYCHGSHIE